MVTKNRGFTFIEVMIVVAIVAILASIAYPSYAQYVRKAQRLELQAELMDISKRLQRYKVANFRYLQADGTAITLENIGEDEETLSVPRQGQALYEITLGDVTATTWTLIATPINNTTQQLDGAVSLNHRGEKCWIKGMSACEPNATTNWDGK
jgi:type IV pilus assembly protein PilE